MMKKYVLVILSIAFLCGCTSNHVSTNQNEMSQSEMETIQLVSSLGMKDELVAVKNRIVIGMVFSGNKDVVQDASLYRSSTEGNYDMIGVFYPNDMDACLSYIDDFLISLKNECNKNYPEEVFKISNAIEKHNDTKIILVVSSDIEKARLEVENVLENQ